MTTTCVIPNLVFGNYYKKEKGGGTQEKKEEMNVLELSNFLILKGNEEKKNEKVINDRDVHTGFACCY